MPRIILVLIFLSAAASLVGQQSNSTTISAGHSHSLALKKYGTVVAWGSNEDKQCDIPYGLKAISVSAGHSHSLALKEDGTVVAWGSNTQNQCDVPYGLKAVAVSAGGFHSLALKEDGTVVAWGWNMAKRCDVPYGLHAVTVSAGVSHSLALTEDGTVVAWGNNKYHQCDVPYGLKAVAISAGSSHSLALMEDGTVVVWGDNYHDQCDVPYGMKAVAISAGSSHSLALMEDGTVVAWGDNYHDRCNVPYGLKAVTISAGRSHSLALKEDGTIVAWGFNDDTQCDVPKEIFARTNAKIQTNSKPPLLEIKAGSITISGATVINGMDSKTIGFDLMNLSGGNAFGLRAQITLEENTSGVSIPSNIDLPSVPVGETVRCEIPISTDRSTVDGMVRIRVEVIEPGGFSPAPFTLELPTKSFRAPLVELVDFSCTPDVWEPLTPISLDLLVQNTGRGDAGDVQVKLELPASIACLSDNETIEIGNLPKGEIVTLKYDLLASRSFTQSQVPIKVTLSESYGDYGSDWSHQFEFKNETEDAIIRYSNNDDSSDETKVEKGSFSSSSNGGGAVTFRETNANHIVKTVAVVPKEGESCSGEKKEADELAAFTENQLLGSYNIVDRKFIDQTLGEIKFTMSGLTKEDQVLQAGCMMAAEGYVFVEYGCFEGTETVTVKMIHCESGENMWISQGVGASAAETVGSIVEGLGGK